MSVSAAQIGTTLVVQSDNQGNTFSVEETNPQVQTNHQAGEVTVTDAAKPLQPPVFEGIAHVVILGGNGGDIITFSGYTLGTNAHAGFANLNRNLILGGTGIDFIRVDDRGTGSTLALGGDGNDFMFVDTTNNTILDGGNGDDQLSAPSFGNTAFLLGGNGNDLFIPNTQGITPPTAQLVVEDGGSGNDTFILAGGTPAIVLGGSGNDSLFIDSTSIGDVIVAASIENTITA
jgi:Ca2+-binding RTX toxin-like protein